MAIKYTLDLLDKFTTEHDIELDEKYEKVNRDTRIEGDCITFECGNKFSKTFRQLYKTLPYCQVCRNRNRKNKSVRKYTIKQVREYVESEGYKLLSTEYKNVGSVLEIECPQGHRCDKTFWDFKSGKRCAECAGNVKYTIKQVREYVENEGYKLLSAEYESANSILEIECPQGHRCDKTFWKFKNGQRCAECSGKLKYTIEQVREYVENEGYKLLSAEYEGANSILEIECPEGHRCDKRFGSFKSGIRCAECAGNVKYTIEQAREYIESEGYTLKSTEYVGTHSKLEIICPKGHSCDKAFADFKNGMRCGMCTNYRSENMCREIIEKILNTTFTKCRPSWLKSCHSELSLELDGYNEELKMAFEYHGRQHYEYIDFFHKEDINKFYLQLERDAHKLKQCELNGIRLIVIPYTITHNSPEELEAFIVDALK